ncbi:hypothetical protein J4230_01150 [Candidatus Woesearchaeota archaeon]|nr:hypothetical protein [Candidatus Woesearchaeota archaeon]
MSHEDKYQYVMGIARNLYTLRHLRNRISQREVAKYIHSRYPRIRANTFQSTYIHYFENRNITSSSLESALDSIEPHRTFLCLYIEALKLNETQREFLVSRLPQGFNLEPDEEILAKGKEKFKPKLITTKLRGLPEPVRKRVETLIDRLYERYVMSRD